jgi:hypothetical protein
MVFYSFKTLAVVEALIVENVDIFVENGGAIIALKSERCLFDRLYQRISQEESEKVLGENIENIIRYIFIDIGEKSCYTIESPDSTEIVEGCATQCGFAGKPDINPGEHCEKREEAETHTYWCG